MKNKARWIVLSIVLGAVSLQVTTTAMAEPTMSQPQERVNVPADALSTAFTYQGKLEDASGPVTDDCEMAFRLYDQGGTGGSQVGSPITATVPITDGLFTVELDFGSGAFTGDARWLGIVVKCPGDTLFANLGRQALTAAPYALYALGASWDGLTGVPADLADGDDNTTYAAGEGLTLNGTEFRAQGTPYANVVVVAKSGGDFTSIQAAIDSIVDAAADNPYMVWVAPGVYSETVAMEPYVDIEGSGEAITKIAWTGSPSVDTGTVTGADNTELRFLTVENTGGNSYAVAIYNDSASPRLTHVTASASGGTTNNVGIWNDNASSPVMMGVTVSVYGENSSINMGVANKNASSPTMTNVTITASGSGETWNIGVSNDASSPTMMSMSISASGGARTYGIQSSQSSAKMMSVTVSASGGSLANTAVWNGDASSPTMIGVTATASGGSYSRGIHNDTGSTPTMQNVIATASGASTRNSAILNERSSAPTIMNSTLVASGTNSYGMYNDTNSSSYTIQIDNCQITGNTSTVRNDSYGTVFIASSLLDGGAVITGGGTVTCVIVWDENHILYISTCH